MVLNIFFLRQPTGDLTYGTRFDRGDRWFGPAGPIRQTASKQGQERVPTLSKAKTEGNTSEFFAECRRFLPTTTHYEIFSAISNVPAPFVSGLAVNAL